MLEVDESAAFGDNSLQWAFLVGCLVILTHTNFQTLAKLGHTRNKSLQKVIELHNLYQDKYILVWALFLELLQTI